MQSGLIIKFRFLSAYYRGADCIIMVYDVTNMESFNHVNDWLAEVNKFAPEDTCKLLVGNKSDKVRVYNSRVYRERQHNTLQHL